MAKYRQLFVLTLLLSCYFIKCRVIFISLFNIWAAVLHKTKLLSIIQAGFSGNVAFSIKPERSRVAYGKKGIGIVGVNCILGCGEGEMDGS